MMGEVNSALKMLHSKHDIFYIPKRSSLYQKEQRPDLIQFGAPKLEHIL
jgi:hypothetical protein